MLAGFKGPRGPNGWWIKTPPSYERLLSDKNVQLWINSYQNAKTRDDYMRCLEVVCKVTGLTPSKILRLNPKEARRKVLLAVQGYLKEGKSTMAKQVQIAMKGFFEANDRELKFKRIDRVRRVLKKINNEVILSKEEVYRMADATKQLRDKAIILCLLQSGVRVGCLCRWTVGMVKSQLYPEVKVPVYVKVTNQVDTKLTGYGLPYYYTFMDKAAAEALRVYLDERIKREGGLKDSGYLFAPISRNALKEAADKDRILYIVKRAAKAIGASPEQIWTHTLRKTFRKVLNASGIDEDTKEALQGHKLPGSRGSYFDYHDVNEIAEKYLKCDWSRGNGNGRVGRLEAYVREMEEKVKRLEAASEAKKPFENELAQVLKDPEVQKMLVRKIRKLGLASRQP